MRLSSGRHLFIQVWKVKGCFLGIHGRTSRLTLDTSSRVVRSGETVITSLKRKTIVENSYVNSSSFIHDGFH